MTNLLLRPLLLALCLSLFAGASCQRSAEPALDEGATEEGAPEENRAEEPAGEPPLPPALSEESASAYAPASTGDRIMVEPAAPTEGETIEVRAGPLTFRNGCEGIARSWAEQPDEEGRIVLRWEPRAVAPGSMCTMALHDDWIEVNLEGLAAGEYLLVAEGVGQEELTVLSSED